MTSKATTAFAMGGIGGQAGNANKQSWTGCTVNCTITGQAKNLVGMVLGTANTLAAKKVITFGTEAAPIKVSGTINGTAISESNVKDFVSGDGKADEKGAIKVKAGGVLNAAYVIFGK